MGWRSRGDRLTVGCESCGAIGSSRPTVWGESSGAIGSSRPTAGVRIVTTAGRVP